MSVDLHTHTKFSDGSMSPDELVRLAHRKGLSCIAITDHDTVEGLQEGFETGRKIGIEVIGGVEVSVKHGDAAIHLLGYLFDPADSNLLEHLRKLQEGREDRNKLILEKLAKQGIILEEEELREISGPGLIGRPHFAKLLVRKSIVRSMDEAFSIYLGKQGTAYASRFTYSLAEMIEVFRKCGGLSVIAHPRQLRMSNPEFAALLSRLSRIGLDGVEVFYPTHSRQYRKLLHTLAAERQLLITGGSDYHGTVRPNTTIAGGKNMAVPDRVVVDMKIRANKKKSLLTKVG